MAVKRWTTVNGYEWAVLEPSSGNPDDLWMCLTLAYGTFNVAPEEIGALHVLMESIGTELKRPVEYAPGQFASAQVELASYLSEIDIRVHGPREIVRQAWLRLPACFENPEGMLPSAGHADASDMWVSEVANRAGISEALLAIFRPDTVTFEAEKYFPAACELARRISPFEARYPCVFVTTEPDFLGLGFDRAPDSLDLDDLLAVNTATPREQYQAGSQWQGGANYLFSFAVPMTRAGLAARWAIAIDATNVLRGMNSRYSDIKVSSAAYSIAPELIGMVRFKEMDMYWDARRFLDQFFKPGRKLTVDLSKIIERVADDENLEVSQHLHRINDTSVPTPAEVRDIIDRAIASAHIAYDVASPQLLQRYPLLTAPKSTYDHFPLYKGYPEPAPSIPYPSTEGTDLLSSVPENLSGYSMILPHHLMVSSDRLVAQWFDPLREGDPTLVTRRVEITIANIAVLLRTGKAYILLDQDGTFLPLYPKAFISPESLVIFDSLLGYLQENVPTLTIDSLFDQEIELVDSFNQYGPRGVEQGTVKPLPDYITHLDTVSLWRKNAPEMEEAWRNPGGTPADNSLSNEAYGYESQAVARKKKRTGWILAVIFMLVFGIIRACAHTTIKGSNTPTVTHIPTISVTLPSFSVPPITLPTPSSTQ